MGKFRHLYGTHLKKARDIYHQLDRLSDYHDATLRFLNHFRVPFTKKWQRGNLNPPSTLKPYKHQTYAN